MRRPLFLPSARQTHWLLIVGFLCLGEAFYLRYLAVENVNVSLACQGGLNTWLCASLRLSTALFRHQAFGCAALAVALLNLLRPSVVLVTLALAAAAFGIVLYNEDLSALAVGALILSLARPAPAAE
jgi:drug/metabolite transporter (DMT)-like permease